jgi:hypothetical protein
MHCQQFSCCGFPDRRRDHPGVGEGRLDYESGLSLYPAARLHVLWLGYLYRTLNQEATRQPGNEFSFLPEIGGISLFGGAGGKLVFDWVFG